MSLLFWGVMALWLLRNEAMPERFNRTMQGYRSLIGDQLERETWMRILIDDTPAGYSFSAIETEADNPIAFSRIRHEMHVRLDLFGATQTIQSSLVVTLDAWTRMQRFTFSLDAGDAPGVMHVDGVRQDRETFRVRSRSALGTRTFEVTIPDNVVIYSPMSHLTLQRLRPGQSLTMRTLDPTTLGAVPITLNALRHESLTVGDEVFDATVISATMLGMASLSWVDRDGNLLRSETPFGWTFEISSPEEAIASLYRTTPEKP